MKPTLSYCFAALVILFSSVKLYAQNDRFAYAVTDVTHQGSNWTVLRKLNLSTGEYSPVLLDGTKTNSIVYDAYSRKQLIRSKAGNETLPFTSGVAALALDKKHNRLYFTPMFINQLRYIDLSSMKVYFITDGAFSADALLQKDGSKTISRMAIAPDGTGYAISNDASTFFEFSTGKKPMIKQLGSLVDDPANKNVSIQNSCTSSGGDIVTDEKGMLYLFTGANNVFKINPQTKVATHLGAIKSLPAGYTTSACLVMIDGKLMVSSAAAKSNFVVDTKSWQATPFTSSSIAYNTSDLANSNYLLSTGKKRLTQIETLTMLKPVPSENIQLYPNPVADNAPFNIQFNNVGIGNYFVQLMDLTGRIAMVKKVTIGSGKTTQVLPVSYLFAKGLYMVRVVNEVKKIVFEQKLIVQ